MPPLDLQPYIDHTLRQARLLKQRHGQPDVLTLSLYATDDDLHQLRPEDGPDATVKVQHRITHACADALRREGFPVRLITVRATDYLKWLTENELPNLPENRAKWLTWQQQ
jgi:hypothetical protein